MTWFDDEMGVLTSTAQQLGLPVAVHTGAADGCKQAIRCGARSLEHAYLIDAHVHLTTDASNLAMQTLQSSAAKAPKARTSPAST